MTITSTTRLSVKPVNRRVTRHRIDAVGNDLTARLAWCDTHAEPVWVYDDNSWECPQTKTVGWDTGDHVIVNAPWELRW